MVVPIIRNTERLSFAQIEQAIADFAARARDNKIKLEETSFLVRIVFRKLICLSLNLHAFPKLLYLSR